MNATVDLRLPFTLRPLTPALGAEISGVKLTEGVSDEVFGAIYRAWLHYQVLLFPPQELAPGRQVTFGRLAIHADLVYQHRWKTGELLVWDNHCPMHRATPYDPSTQRRVVRRCTLLGEAQV